MRTGSNDLVVLRLGPNGPSDMTITSQEIPRDAWRRYFDALTDVLGTVEGTVEVIGRDGGDQIADERQVLTDITYDDRGDALIVGLGSPIRVVSESSM